MTVAVKKFNMVACSVRDVEVVSGGDGSLTMHMYTFEKEWGSERGETGLRGEATGVEDSGAEENIRDDDVGGRHVASTNAHGGRCDGDGKPLLVLCIHGAGYSGLTFAPLAESLVGTCGVTGGGTGGGASRGGGRGTCGVWGEGPGMVVVAPDLRGHGGTRAADEMDLSIETLVGDVEALYEVDLRDRYGDVVLVGWSMGAAVAIKAASKAGHALASRVVGLVAIDVVEGTAMEALKSMASILAMRPKGFDSIEEAVAWAVSSGTTRRRESAEISVPGMLLAAGEDFAGGVGLSMGVGATTAGSTTKGSETMGPPPPIPRYPTIREDGGEEQEKPCEKRDTGKRERGGKTSYKYVWRVALERTERFWTGWFQGLSRAFLDVRAPKLLLLAGHDRLDKTLTIAQMQGKFQMAVVPDSGHAIHEDQPRLVADKICAFLERHLGNAARDQIVGRTFVRE